MELIVAGREEVDWPESEPSREGYERYQILREPLSEPNWAG
jgi:hypothetical protein